MLQCFKGDQILIVLEGFSKPLCLLPKSHYLLSTHTFFSLFSSLLDPSFLLFQVKAGRLNISVTVECLGP